MFFQLVINHPCWNFWETGHLLSHYPSFLILSFCINKFTRFSSKLGTEGPSPWNKQDADGKMPPPERKHQGSHPPRAMQRGGGWKTDLPNTPYFRLTHTHRRVQSCLCCNWIYILLHAYIFLKEFFPTDISFPSQVWSSLPKRGDQDPNTVSSDSELMLLKEPYREPERRRMWGKQGDATLTPVKTKPGSSGSREVRRASTCQIQST